MTVYQSVISNMIGKGGYLVLWAATKYVIVFFWILLTASLFTENFWEFTSAGSKVKNFLQAAPDTS